MEVTKCALRLSYPPLFSYVSVFSCFPLEDYVPLTSRQTLCPSFAVASCYVAFLVLLPLTFRQTPERVLRTVIENTSSVRDRAERGRELFHFKRGSSARARRLRSRLRPKAPLARGSCRRRSVCRALVASPSCPEDLKPLQLQLMSILNETYTKNKKDGAKLQADVPRLPVGALGARCRRS